MYKESNRKLKFKKIYKELESAINREQRIQFYPGYINAAHSK